MMAWTYIPRSDDHVSCRFERRIMRAFVDVEVYAYSPHLRPKKYAVIIIAHCIRPVYVQRSGQWANAEMISRQSGFFGRDFGGRLAANPLSNFRISSSEDRCHEMLC